MPLQDLAAYLENNGIPWLPCRVDGCCYGMKDSKGEMYVKKKCLIRTTDERFHRVFRAKVCPGNHGIHATIQGSETSVTSYDPWRMVQAIARHWRGQEVPSRHLRLLAVRQDLPELPSGDSLPPGCSQQDLPELPSGDSLLPCRSPQDLPELPTGDYCRQAMVVDRTTSPFRLLAEASQTEFLDGVTEQEVRQWEAQVSKFHRAAGHPTNKNLSRIVQEAGHPQWKVDVALRHVCPACQSLKPGGTSSSQIPPSTTHGLYPAWEAVGIDVGQWVIPQKKEKIKFIIFVDVATKLRAIHPLLLRCGFLEMKAESGHDVTKGFAERWLSSFPKPKVVIMHSAKAFASEAFHEFLAGLNVQAHFVAEKESWAHGVIEAVVQDVKFTASAIQLEAKDQDPMITLFLATSAPLSTLLASPPSSGPSAKSIA